MPLGLLAGILAQTCAVMLPATSLEFEWFQDGRPYAEDILLRTRAGERLYQRRYADGESAERVVSCTRSGRSVVLTDRVGSAAPVRIPVDLPAGALRRVGGTAVRRVAAPQGAPGNMLWFAVTSPGLVLYGARRAAGITEIRTPAPGGYTVLRAIARNRASRAAADSQFKALARRVEELETENRQLRDSVRTLRSRAARDSARAARARGAPRDSSAERRR